MSPAIPNDAAPPVHSRRAPKGRRSAAVAGGALLLCALLPGAAFGAVSVSPAAPPGAAGLQDLLDWSMWGGAIVCAITAIYGLAKMGFSHAHQSYQGANHGKAVALLGFAGALGLGLTPAIINGLTGVH